MAVVVTRVTGEKQAERLTKLYAQAEREISSRLQRAISRRGSNSYTARQLQRQQAEVRAIIEELRKTSPAYINKFVKAAYGGGVKIAEEQLTQAGIAIIGKMGGINAKVMAVYSSQITSRLSEVLTTAGNRTEDIYNILRKDSALTGVLSGYESITQAEKRLLENAADGDVIGFVDKAGRQWNMKSYVEMLTRTNTMRIHNEAKRIEYLAHGEDLVIVSSHGGSCPMCSPFDGKVLSLTGATRTLTGKGGYVDIIPTLDEAKAEGFMHPNCKHTYSLYIDDDPDVGYTEFIEAKTIKEANEYTKKVLNISNVDYTGLDLEMANEWNKSLFQMQKEFPEVYANINLVGSCQYRNTVIEQLEFDDKYKELVSLGATDKYAAKRAKKYAEMQVKAYYSIGPTDNAQSFFINTGRTELLTPATGITLNNQQSYSEYLAHRKLNVLEKTHPVGCDKLKSTFDHEFGHQLTGYLGAHRDSVIINAYNSRTTKQMTDELSSYAHKNIDEFISEAWAEYRNNDKCRPLAKQIGDRIMELYKAKVGK